MSNTADRKMKDSGISLIGAIPDNWGMDYGVYDKQIEFKLKDYWEYERSLALLQAWFSDYRKSEEERKYAQNLAKQYARLASLESEAARLRKELGIDD